MLKYKKFLSLFYTIIVILSIIALSSSWKNQKNYKNTKEFQERIPLNWNKNLITSIQIIKNDESCFDQYQPIINTQLFDQNSLNNYLQINNEDLIQQFKIQVTQTHINSANLTIDSFAFSDTIENEQSSWKMCAKFLTDVSFTSQKNQLLELCEPDEKICPVENNKIVCVPKQYRCPSSIFNYCPYDKKQCLVNTKIECIEYGESCPKEDKTKQCLSSQKICIIQDRVLCQDANEQCPIVDILLTEKSDKTPEDYEEELIRFDSNYKLLVKRNDAQKWPVVELAIQRDNNSCLIDNNQNTNLFTMKNESCQLDKCMDGNDGRYQEIFYKSLSTNQLFFSNNIIDQYQEFKVEFRTQFKIYQRKYFFFDTKCSYSNEFDGFNIKYQKIVGRANLILSTMNMILLVINIIIHYLLLNTKIKNEKCNKLLIYIREYSYQFILIISILNVILLNVIDIKYIKQLMKFAQRLIDEQCVDQYIQQNFQDVLKQLNVLKKFQSQNFILSIIITLLIFINTKFEVEASKQYRVQNGMKVCFIVVILNMFCQSKKSKDGYERRQSTSSNQEKTCEDNCEDCCEEFCQACFDSCFDSSTNKDKNKPSNNDNNNQNILKDERQVDNFFDNCCGDCC